MPIAAKIPTRPTLYLLDESGPSQLLHRLMPRWRQKLGTSAMRLDRLPTPPERQPNRWREIIEFIRIEHHARGAVAPSIQHLGANPDLEFDALCPNATALGTFDLIVKKGATLTCRLSAPDAAGRALDDVVPPDRTPPSAVIFGATPLGAALALQLLQRGNGRWVGQVVVTDPDLKALNEMAPLRRTDPQGRLAMHHAEHASDLTRLLAGLPLGSLLINATTAWNRAPSLRPEAVAFPAGATVWDPTTLNGSPLLDAAAPEMDRQGLILANGETFQLHLLAGAVAELAGRKPTATWLRGLIDSGSRAVQRIRATG